MHFKYFCYSALRFNGFLVKKQERISNGKQTLSPVNSVGKLENNMQKNETGSLFYTIHQN